MLREVKRSREIESSMRTLQDLYHQVEWLHEEQARLEQARNEERIESFRVEEKIKN